jgi:predicted 3-demethylubiquinone-9 3-methyltransferase (glyoxalase superfamily)
MARIIPHLWYSTQAEEAARFYAAVIPNSKVDAVTSLPADSPSGPAGSVTIVEFTLCGARSMISTIRSL